MTKDKKPPAQSESAPNQPTRPGSSQSEIDAFLRQVAAQRPAAQTGGSARGRLIFAMDATMSRQPTWDMALQLQAQMFDAVKAVGTLDVQLVYFRGYDECRASSWVSDARGLARLMSAVECRGGFTQIRKVLAHARREAEKGKIGALVYVGDCMEEDIDHLSHIAGELGLLGVPVFLFQEGYDSQAGAAFAEIARLSGGAHCRFDAGSAAQLLDLLKAVAVYAAGGRAALEDLSARAGGARLLLGQIKR